jgi:hypothetical protein
MSDNVDGTIHAREKTHGEYELQSALSQEIKRIMRITPNWEKLRYPMRESLDMIAVKISRILHGDPTHADSWHDIAGYARLIDAELD